MTEEELEKFTDEVITVASRINSSTEQEEWEFNRNGIKSAIALHIAVMMTLRKIPIDVQN